MLKLAVLGSPIAHSKSPRLHLAAYEALGLDWSYEAIDVAEHELEAFVATLEDGWRGLSLTMPLKRTVLPLLTNTDDLVALTGVANTLVFDAKKRWGFNTDVYGIVQAFADNGVSSVDSATILGGGATAASAVAAVVHMGARRVRVVVRNAARTEQLVAIGAQLGIDVEVVGFESGAASPDVVVSTLPGATPVPEESISDAATRSLLLDVAYDPWPSALAESWQRPVISGLSMLTHQALAQVRAFVNGSPELELDDEPAVLAAMRAAVA